MCGESWHATKDLQPTVPVLKAGHPVSCSCVFVLVCLVRVRGDLFSFLKFFGWCAIHMYFHVYVKKCTSTRAV